MWKTTLRDWFGCTMGSKRRLSKQAMLYNANRFWSSMIVLEIQHESVMVLTMRALASFIEQSDMLTVTQLCLPWMCQTRQKRPEKAQLSSMLSFPKECSIRDLYPDDITEGSDTFTGQLSSNDLEWYCEMNQDKPHKCFLAAINGAGDA